MAGLATITPASGFVKPMPALLIGFTAGVLCYLMVAIVKNKFGYDDSLDAFGVHCIGGIVGAMLTGAFAAPALGGFGSVTDIGAQLVIQAKGVMFTIVYTGTFSYLILQLLKHTIGLRVEDEEETIGLDLSLHDERGYNL